MSHLSASALQQFEEQPIRFYLERCGPLETKPPPEPQGYPAAVGVAFDAYVKRAVADTLKLPCPPLDDLLKNAETEHDRAIALGAELIRAYSDCGALEMLLAENPCLLDERREGMLPDPIDPVPLVGVIDAVTSSTSIHDWKTTGANQPGQRSPTPGYEFFLGFDGQKIGPHARCGEPLETLNARWATQIATYGMLFGFYGQVRASIDEVIVGRGVARYRTIVSEDFVAQVRDRYRAAWSAIQEERVVAPKVAACGLEAVRTLKEMSKW